MQVTRDQLAFCRMMLLIMVGSLRNRLVLGKPRMEFSLQGNLLLCQLFIGLDEVDRFYPEVYA